MPDTLTLDVNLAMEEGVGPGGLSRTDLEAMRPRAEAIHQEIRSQRAAGKLAFLDLPKDKAAAEAARSLGQELASQFENLLVLGIGGSSLGPKALYTALKHPLQNLLPLERRRNQCRLFFPDNSDPSTFAALLEVLDLPKTAVAAITKSGGTAETWAQLLLLRERLRAQGGAEAVRRQVVAITDPSDGALRAVAKGEGWRTLPVPPPVGGRFSVLTAVGLLPAAAAGIDTDALLQGAAAMAARCEEPDLLRNPGYLLGAVLQTMDVKKGRHVHVFMPYADALRETADWFVQLWAESLGKQGKSGPVGPTPLPAVGTTDQHSLLQLLMEGPLDKMVVFVAVDKPRVDLTIPKDLSEHPEVAYLGGHTFHELLLVEQRATAAALAAKGRPSVTVRLPALTPYVLGELMMLLEIATAFAGALYGINAYDQPGVEAGKRYASGLLGRSGYETARRELEGRPTPRKEYIL